MEKLLQGAKQLGLDLAPRQIEQFQLYYEELISWNRRINLTAITDYEEVQVKHFLDSLTLVLVLDSVQPAAGRPLRVLDIGTGAGLPGIPLKILIPSIELVLLESVAKKTAFLQSLVRRLSLEGVQILTARAEDIGHDAHYREQFDVVLSRAVGKLPTIVELSLPFCLIGGIFVAQKKGDIAEELQQADTAITKLGGRLERTKRIELPDSEQGKERLLVVIRKVQPTPEQYPRRPGVPGRRPLR